MSRLKPIISRDRSIIPAADVGTVKEIIKLSKSVAHIDGIHAIKVGIELGLEGLGKAVAAINASDPDMKIIYDHQKAGNDIPPMGVKFANKLKSLGIDVAILFPFAGPATQAVWTNACFDAGLEVMTGGIMTHSEFLVSEGGYISDDAPERIYRLACKLGVRHFVVPGTKLHWVKKIREILIEELGEGSFVLYAPGFIDQGGSVTECGEVAGDKWHAIVGGAIYNATDQRQVTENLVKTIL